MNILIGIIFYTAFVGFLLQLINKFEKKNKELEDNAHLKEYFERRYRE